MFTAFPLRFRCLSTMPLIAIFLHSCFDLLRPPQGEPMSVRVSIGDYTASTKVRSPSRITAAAALSRLLVSIAPPADGRSSRAIFSHDGMIMMA